MTENLLFVHLSFLSCILQNNNNNKVRSLQSMVMSLASPLTSHKKKSVPSHFCSIYSTVVLNDTRNEPNKKQPKQKECSQSQRESVLRIMTCKSSVLITFVLPWRIL